MILEEEQKGNFEKPTHLSNIIIFALLSQDVFKYWYIMFPALSFAFSDQQKFISKTANRCLAWIMATNTYLSIIHDLFKQPYYNKKSATKYSKMRRKAFTMWLRGQSFDISFIGMLGN